MTDDLIRRKDALNFEITVEGPREAEEAILRTSQGIMDYIKSLPAAGEAPSFNGLKKRSQVDRLTIAAVLVKGVEAEVEEGNREDGLLELASGISAKAGNIVRTIYSEIFWRAYFKEHTSGDKNADSPEV